MVHVVIPFLDAEATLDRAVQSALAQTWRDFLLILVDDGSRDACREKAQAWTLRDPRIRFLPLPANRGPAGARNAGARLRPCRFLAFLDADDAFAPTFLEQTVNHLLRHPEADGVKTGVETGLSLPPEKSQAIANSLATNLVVRREVFDFVEGFPEDPVFRTELGGEDIALNHLLFPPFHVAFLPEPLYRHTVRTRVDSHTARFLDHSRVEDGALHFDQDAARAEKTRALNLRILELVERRDLKLRLFVRRFMGRL